MASREERRDSDPHSRSSISLSFLAANQGILAFENGRKSLSVCLRGCLRGSYLRFSSMIGDGHIALPPPPHGNIVRGLARWSAGGGEARQVAERERGRESRSTSLHFL